MNIDNIMTSPNIAEDLDRADLQEIGNKVVEGFERDLDSRAEWEERNAEALKLALQVREGKSYPWPNAANVHYPLVTVACMQYNARAYPALVPNSKMVKHRVIGADPDGSKEARARRVSSHMNYQLTVEDEAWEEGFDRLLMTEPLLGCSFEKSYFDGEKTVNEHVTPEYFVVDYYTKSLEECRRQTHIIPKHKNQIVERMRTGEWKEYDISDKYASYEQSEISNAMDEAQGVVEPYDTEDAPFTVIEQHCYLDLDNDGYDEPYIVTVLTDTREVLRIVPRFQPENILFNQRGQVAKITPDTYFTKFGFIPSPDGGFYDIGFGILLSPMNESVNTIINQLIDAGTLSNLQSGFISKNVRIADGRAQFTPGEWKKVNATGDDLRKGIMPLPVREPSQTLMALLGVLIEAGQKIGSVSEMMMGENPGQNQPAMTTMNVLEQGLKVYSSIIKRNHRSLKSMFRKMYKLNALYMNPEEYFEVIDEQAGQGQNEQQQGVVYQSDYFGDPKDIAPVSDPNIVSDAQRLAKAETVLGRAQANPVMYNVYEAERRYLEAIQESGIDKLLLPQDQIQPPVDEEMELEKAKFEHQVRMDQINTELNAQETVVNMRKKIADTERSMVNASNVGERMELETFKAVSEVKLRRAELIADAMREVNKLEDSKKKTVENREDGGNVNAGQPYIVGEAGAEAFVPDHEDRGTYLVGGNGEQLFIPPEDGEIIPNDELKEVDDDYVELSPMVKKIATEEGWELDPYEDPGKEGGINIGNAILFSQQSPEKFRKIGIKESIIKKIETLGWFGVKGKEAAEILARTKDSHNVTESEVNEIANKVTDAGMNDLRKLIPDLDAAYTFGQQALVGSMYHQYGKKLFSYDAWKQFKNKDWPALVNNLITWSEKKGDTEESRRVAKSIEGRRARESKWIDEE